MSHQQDLSRFQDISGLSPASSAGDEPGVRLSVVELQELQGNGLRHIGFEVTSACPLRCRHCMAMPANGQAKGTLPIDRARAYAGELESLHNRGLRHISFTGGEPLLFPDRVEILSGAAASLEISTSVVTACQWAFNESSAGRMVDALPHVHAWHLSTDVFHAEFVSPDSVIRAAEAAVCRGRTVIVRMAADRPVSDAHRALHAWLKPRLPEEAAITVQGVIGSATSSADTAAARQRLCLPCGLLVRHDGSIAPCCSALSDRRKPHPFERGRVDDNGILPAYARWISDPLLQLVQAAGFDPVLQWALEIDPDTARRAAACLDACDCCVALWQSKDLRTALSTRAEDNAARIDELFRFVFPSSPGVIR